MVSASAGGRIVLVALLSSAANCDVVLDRSSSLRASLSAKLGSEMNGYLSSIEQQLAVNRAELTNKLQKENFINAAASFGYMTGIVIQIYATFYGRTFASTGDVLNVAGIAVEDAAYDAEGFLTVKSVDTQCLSEFGPLVSKYKLSYRLDEFDRTTFYERGGLRPSAVEREKLRLDIADFRRKFQESLSCVITSDIFSGEQRLLGLLGLYAKAAEMRLDIFD